MVIYYVRYSSMFSSSPHHTCWCQSCTSNRSVPLVIWVMIFQVTSRPASCLVNFLLQGTILLYGTVTRCGLWICDFREGCQPWAIESFQDFVVCPCQLRRCSNLTCAFWYLYGSITAACSSRDWVCRQIDGWMDWLYCQTGHMVIREKR